MCNYNEHRVLTPQIGSNDDPNAFQINYSTLHIVMMDSQPSKWLSPNSWVF